MRTSIKRALCLFLTWAFVTSTAPSVTVVVGQKPVTGGGGITLVASVSATGAANGETTGAVNTTGANLIVIAIYYVEGATSLAVSDSKSNTWTPLTTRGATFHAKLYYCASPTVGSGHTFTISGTQMYSGIAAVAFSGANASPFDTESGASATQPGSITPAVSNELFVVCWGRNDSTTLTINSSFTIAEQTTYAPGDGLELGLAYKVSSSAENPTTNTDESVAMAAFKP